MPVHQVAIAIEDDEVPLADDESGSIQQRMESEDDRASTSLDDGALPASERASPRSLAVTALEKHDDKEFLRKMLAASLGSILEWSLTPVV